MAGGNSLRLAIFIIAYLVLQSCRYSYASESDGYGSFAPTVVLAFLARNKEYALPWFLGHIDRLDYPKDRIALWIRTDHNIDSTGELLRQWTDKVRSSYHSVDLVHGEDGGYPDEYGPSHWSRNRMDHVIAFRQAALDAARHIWADYLFMLDCDAFLLNPRVLHFLIQQQRTIVAPMLSSTEVYSNFWGAMNSDGFYERSDDYLDIVDQIKRGLFPVPLVNSAYLINLKDKATQFINYSPASSNYGYANPNDIFQFAVSVKNAGITPYVLNTEFFGILPTPKFLNDSLADDAEAVTFLKLRAMIDKQDTSPSAYVTPVHRSPSKLGFDEIYFINLERRDDRKRLMLASFEELGIKAKHVSAVDGKYLNENDLVRLGIRQLEGYEDPYNKRPLKMGEIACFLSHYYIWKEVVDLNYSKVIIFEDDVRFGISFVSRLHQTMADIARLGYRDTWELLYLGHKLMDMRHKPIDGYELMWPGYTYWAIGYGLSTSGARKLLAQRPLEKMVPVDELLPIMFDRHDRPDWMDHFGPRDVVALAAWPALLTPMHYTGQQYHVSDTEDSIITNREPASKMQQASQSVNAGIHSEL